MASCNVRAPGDSTSQRCASRCREASPARYRAESGVAWLEPSDAERCFHERQRDKRTCSVNQSLPEFSDDDRGALRALVSEIDGELAALVARGPLDGTAAQVDTLASSWARLTKLIALEPEPQLRTCPHCKQPVMRVATRCVHCWKQSNPEALTP